MASDSQQGGAATDEPQAMERVQRKQRILAACLQCRSRKRRCDGQRPTCSNCISGRAACQYPHVQKRRGEGKSKLRIRALEDRLLTLESKLRRSHSVVVEPEHNNHGESADAQPLDPPGNAPESSGVSQTSTGISQTVQSPSSYDGSLQPRHPLFRGFSDRIAELRARGPAGSFKITVASPILPKNLGLALLEHSLEEICQEFPLINARELLHQLRTQGAASIEACGSASRWACVNAAFALSVHLKTANGAFQELSPVAWAYFKNAYATLPELMLQANDPEAIKALVLMAVFGQSSADARTTSLLLSLALRLSQTLAVGSLRASQGGSRNAAETEDDRRTLWAACILDAEMSLCCGFGSALGAGDIEIDLPGKEPLQDGHDHGQASVSIFRRRVELALLHSAVRTRLYSAAALKMSQTELLSTIVTLDQEFEDWRRTVPPDVQPGFVEAALEPHCVVLHLSFHNLISMVHWAARRHSGWNAAPGSMLMNLSKLKVRDSAQHTLHLWRQLPFEQFSQFWRNLGYPLSAAMTLLLCTLESPDDADAKADVELLRGFARQVKDMQDEGDFELSNMLKACLGLEHFGSVAIGQSVSDVRSGAGTEPLPDALPHGNAQAIRNLLSSAAHPMYLAQGFLTNLPNRDTELCQSMARIFGIPLTEGDRYGPLVPRCVKPQTYSFGFSTQNENTRG